MAEGLVATSYFWLLLCLITFGQLTILRLALIAVLAVGILDLHEQMSWLGPVLFLSCAIRWRSESRLLPRTILALAAVCALASTVIAVYFVFQPISFADRNGFIINFLKLRWLYKDGEFNLPCVLGMLAVVLLAVARPGRESLAIWTFGVISLALLAFSLDRLIAPFTQFAARYNGALISIPLAALLLFGRAHKPLISAITRAPAGGIIAVLGVTVSLWHVSASHQWTSFLTHFSNVLQSRDGIIAWDSVIAPTASRQAALAAKMVWGWTNPDLSLVVLRRSCVSSVINNPTYPPQPYVPYTLSNLETMPILRGVAYTYLLPPDQERVACFTM